MADDLIHGGLCGDTWWNNSCTSRNMFGSSSFCSSSTISDLGGAFGWSNISLFDDIKTTTTSTDASLLLHQDVLNVINDSLDSTNTSEWNEALLQTNGSSHQGSYQIILQDDFKLDINNSNYHQQPNNVMDFCPSTYGSDQESSNTTNYTLNPSASTDHSTFLHNIFLDNNTTMQEPLFENHQAANFTSSPTTCGIDNNFMNMNDFPLMKQPPLAFSNDKSSTMKVGHLPSTQLQAPLTSSVGDKYNRPKATTAKSNIGAGAKKTNDETPFKRPRLETPSHLPTFKVRKEKLGDRITALQQLVSPFGKTDTASVLHEAIEYIKFLHDKVNVMSTPYMKNGPASQRQQGLDEQDLRSRGLCIVPLSSTFSLDAQPPTDFWAPTLGGPFRNDQFEEWNGGSHIDLPCNF